MSLSVVEAPVVEEPVRHPASDFGPWTVLEEAQVVAVVEGEGTVHGPEELGELEEVEVEGEVEEPENSDDSEELEES